MKNKLKVVCINNYTYNGFEEEMCRLLPLNECIEQKWFQNKNLIIGEIYEVEPFSDYGYWMIDSHLIFKKDRFLTLAEWRNKQIDSILND